MFWRTPLISHPELVVPVGILWKNGYQASVSLFPNFGVSIDDGLLINVSDTFDVSDIISILGGKKTGMTGFYWLGITEKRYLLNSF